MRHGRQLCQWISLLVYTMVVLTSCAYETAVGRLSPAEQGEFYIYRHVITSAQIRTYLAQATAAERTAYLNKIGLAQRFQALDPLDRDAIRSGLPRPGMSAEALHFVWGEPYYMQGRARHSEHWYYLGPSIGLAASGNRREGFGNRVDVYLVDGRVVAWVDFAPTTPDDSSDCQGC